jgi:Arsenical resistance operon protein ArsD
MDVAKIGVKDTGIQNHGEAGVVTPAKTIMDVYDPAMCCSTGVCGPAPDPFLPRFAADLEWLASQGVDVRRHNLSQEPAAFAGSEPVKAALTTDGTDCLPMILVNGEVVSKGKYPVRYTLARWAGIKADQPTMELPILTTKSGGTGCC